MTPKELKRIIEHKMNFDSVVVRNGIVICKRGYFYHHGVYVEALAQAIQSFLPQAKIVSTRDFFKAWPADSYMEVRCQFIQ